MGHGLLDVGQRGGGARAALAVLAERGAEVREGGRRDHEPRQAEERVDLAAEHPDIVAKLQAAMPGLNFSPYTGEGLLPDEAPHYYCPGAASEARDSGAGGTPALANVTLLVIDVNDNRP